MLWDRCLHRPRRLSVTFSLSPHTRLAVLFLRWCSSCPVSFLWLIPLRIHSLFISDISFPLSRVSLLFINKTQRGHLHGVPYHWNWRV